MDADEYQTFARGATRRLIELNKQCEITFRMGAYERWDYDLETGSFTFSDNGVTKVAATIQVVGSISSEEETWLWSWANASIPEPACEQILRVREFGIANEVDRLTQPKWLVEEEADGWEMAAVSTAILSGKGVYRCPTKTGITFVVFTEINFAIG